MLKTYSVDTTYQSLLNHYFKRNRSLLVYYDISLMQFLCYFFKKKIRFAVPYLSVCTQYQSHIKLSFSMLIAFIIYSEFYCLSKTTYVMKIMCSALKYYTLNQYMYMLICFLQFSYRTIFITKVNLDHDNNLYFLIYKTWLELIQKLQMTYLKDRILLLPPMIINNKSQDVLLV